MSDVMEQNGSNVELNAAMPREQMERAPDSTHLSDAALLASC